MRVRSQTRRPAAEPEPGMQFQLLFECGSWATIVVLPDDPRFTIVAVSDAYLRATSTKREEIVGCGLFEVFPDNPSDPGAQGHRNVVASLRQAITSRREDRISAQRYDVRKASGAGTEFETHYWDLLSKPVVSQGEVRFIIHTVEDVTAHYETRARQRLLERLVEQASEVISMTRPDGTVTYLNAAGRNLTGRLEGEELAGRKLVDLFGIENRQAVEEVLRGLREQPGGSSGEIQLNQVEAGQQQPIQYTNFSIKDEEGRVEALATLWRDLTEQRRAAAALHASEARLSSIVGQATAGIVETDLTGRFLLVNDRYCAIVGRSREELLALRMQDVTHPEDRERNLPFSRAGSLRHPFVIEKRYLRPDGGVVWVHSSMSTNPGRDGEPSSVVGVSIDITERKQREMRDAFLVELDDKIRGIRDPDEIPRTASVLLGEHLGVSRCTYVTVEGVPEACEIVGDYVRGEHNLAGRYAELPFGSECARLMRSGQPYVVNDTEGDERAATALAFYRPADIRSILCVPLCSDNRMAAVFAVHHNTPRHWRLHEIELVQLVAQRCRESMELASIARELAESERKFRTLAESLPQLVWTSAADGRWNYLSRQWVIYTELEESEQVGLSWLARLHPEDRERTLELWKDALEGKAKYDLEFRIRRYDGIYRWFKTRARPLLDHSGAVSQWFGTCTDIDEQKRIEQDLRRANQDLEQFAYSASHDLQEPLRNVAIYSQYIQRRWHEKFDDETKLFFGHVIEGSHRMTQLVADLLAYTKAANLDDLPDAVSQSYEAFENARASLDTQIHESGAVVSSDSLPELAVKSAHLQQLLLNLFSNAIKYRRDNVPPRVHLSAALIDEFWRFGVHDNGIGIDPEYRHGIFGIFKRLHGREKYSGTGIGLAICQKIVERYGGKIWVESQLGAGATFYFTLPALNAKE